MWKRLIVVGLATGLALVVLFLALTADPSARPAPRPSIEDPINADAFTGLGTREAAEDGVDPRGQAKKYHIQRHTSSGQLVELFGDSLTPQPQGVSRVERPGARIHLAPHRVIELRAEDGTFVAPNNEPRRGEFVGRVVLTLFECDPARQTPAGSEPGDAKLRLFLDDARFDLELGLIESDRSVHLVGPNVDFRGEGLSLNYNERRKRIDRLLIPHGRSMRFHPVTDEPPDRVGSTDAARRRGEESHGTAGERRAQFYRARLVNRVTVRSPAAVIEAERLDVVFSLDSTTRAVASPTAGPPDPPLAPTSYRPAPRGAIRWSPVRPYAIAAAWFHRRAARAPEPVALARWVQQATARTATVGTTPRTSDDPTLDAADPDALPPDTAMAPVGPGDVTVTWSGPLLVEPEDAPPLDLTDPAHALFELVGQPVRVSAGSRLTAEASRLDYLSSSGRVRLMSSEDQPLTVTAPGVGRVNGQNMVIWAGEGTGQMTGPGRALMTGDLAGLATESAPPSDQGNGHAVAISWSDQLDLDFYRGNPAPTDPVAPGVARYATGLSAITGLRGALFRGAAQVKSARFAIESGRLGVSLSPPVDGAQKIETIRAEGHACLTVRPIGVSGSDDTDAHNFKLAASELLLSRPADTAVPAPANAIRVEARGGVEARDGDDVLRTEMLTARLDASRPGDDGLPDGALAGAVTSDDLRVTTMQARDGVQIDTAHPDMLVTADRCDADLIAGRFDLYGVSGQPARAQWRQGGLTGDQVVIDRRAEAIEVPGPGRFTYDPGGSVDEHVGPSDTPAVATTRAGRAGQEPGEPGAPSTHAAAHRSLSIAWAKSMRFDSAEGRACFSGAVEASSVSGPETSRLGAEQLTLAFDGATPTAPASQPAGSTANLSAASEITGQGDALSAGLRLRSASAEGSVVLVDERWGDQRRVDLLTRLRASGPALDVYQEAGQVEVFGPGTLLYEDYRGDGDGAGAGDAWDQADGRGGQTLFTWRGRLWMDGAAGRVMMTDGVQVLHQPLPGGRSIQLDCRVLEAKLTTPPTAGPAPTAGSLRPRVEAVYASDAVRVLAHDRTVYTDQAEYRVDSQSLILRAHRGRVTRLYVEGEPAVHTAQQFRWDLAQNRIEITQPTTGPTPLR